MKVVICQPSIRLIHDLVIYLSRIQGLFSSEEANQMWMSSHTYSIKVYETKVLTLYLMK